MNKSPIPKKETTSQSNNQPFSQETIRSLQELGEAFQQIHRRLMSEGYVLRNGKFIKPGPGDTANGAEK